MAVCHVDWAPIGPFLCFFCMVVRKAIERGTLASHKEQQLPDRSLRPATMAALLRQGARRIGGSMLQRTQAAVTSPAVAEERRRLVPRRMHSSNEGAGKDGISKWEERRLAFKRFDSDFTKVLNSVAGIYCIYAILAVGDDPPWPIRKYVAEYDEEEAETDKKKRKE